MSLSNFFKKLFGKERISENKEEIAKEIPFNELENAIEDKKLELETQQREIISSIKNLFSEFLNELAEKIEILQNFDLESKKAEAKLKLIVKENLSQYISNLQELIKRLSELEEKGLEELTKKANKIFSEFDKRSYLNYEKATILIGKEIAEVKEAVKKCYNSLKKIFEENSNLIFSLDSIPILKNNLKEIGKFNAFISELNNKINFLEKKIKEISEKNKKFLLEIEEIKKSEEYEKNLKKEKEINALKEELEREIYFLKDQIDFKALGREFHSDEKKMRIIKHCKENFASYFENESEFQKLIILINEAKLNFNKISEIRNSLKDKKEKISRAGDLLKENSVKDLLSEIEKNSSEIEMLNLEKEKIMKNNEKIEQKIKNLKEETIQKALKINLEVKINS